VILFSLLCCCCFVSPFSHSRFVTLSVSSSLRSFALSRSLTLSPRYARLVRSPAQETAALEHANFALAQESAVKSELKAVLDSWVRFEQSQRESEQAALVQAVQTAVDAEVVKPAFRKQLLEEAVARVEALAKNKSI
jgi:hypothetical protein